jgi:flagellar export protein FliJ
LGGAIRNEEALRKACEEAIEHLERCGEQLTEATNGITNVGTLRNLSLAVRFASDEAKAAEVDHRASEDVVQEEQERFGEARKQRRVVERFRERRRQAWSLDAARKEQRDHDGLAQQRWARRGES